MKEHFLAMIAASAFITACASPPSEISSLEKQPVKVMSEPDGALITASVGLRTVESCKAPCTLHLDPSKAFLLRATLDGYYSSKTTIDSGLRTLDGGVATGMAGAELASPMGANSGSLAVYAVLAAMQLATASAHNEEVISKPLKLPSEVKLKLRSMTDTEEYCKQAVCIGKL